MDKNFQKGTFYQEHEVMTRNMTRNTQEHDKTCRTMFHSTPGMTGKKMKALRLEKLIFHPKWLGDFVFKLQVLRLFKNPIFKCVTNGKNAVSPLW